MNVKFKTFFFLCGDKRSPKEKEEEEEELGNQNGKNYTASNSLTELLD